MFACKKPAPSTDTAAQSYRNSRSYSAGRLFALGDYCKSTPQWRVLMTLLLSPAPALLLLLLADRFPLQDPRQGWELNVNYWIRICVSSGITAWVALLETQLVVPEMNLTAARKLAIAAGVGGGYTGIMVVLARWRRFPVPFTMTIGAAPFGMLLNLLVACSLGSADQNLLRRYFKFANFCGMQTSMLVVYPAYNAAFLSLEGVPQLAFLLLLPMIKLAYKYLATVLQSEEDDLVPGLHSSVDIFDALYMAKCMQSAGTLAVAFGIILLDLVQNYVAITRLTKQSRSLQAVMGPQSSNNLLSLVFKLLEKMQQLEEKSLRFGSRRLSVSMHSEAELSRLRSIQVAPESNRVVFQTNCSRPKASAIHPFASIVSSTPVAPQPESSNEVDILRETTCLLHESEAIVVVEYIETVVPVMYAIYISILFHLPNAKYYQDMQHMTEERLHKMVVNILIYAGMELLSLVYVYGVLKRKFGVSVFYQLAFALENDWRMYQAHFVAWGLIAFQFLLIHCGEVSLASEFRLCLRSVTD